MTDNPYIFFIGYPWDVHNQVERSLASNTLINDRTVKVGIYCDGKSEHLRSCCEVTKNIANDEQRMMNCSCCLQHKKNFFRNSFDKEINLSDGSNSHCIQDLANLEYKNMSEIEQRMIISPVLSDTRTSSTTEAMIYLGEENYMKIFEKYLYSTYEVQNQFLGCLQSLGISRNHPLYIFTYNGRFHPYQAILNIAKREKYQCIIHERGSLPNNWKVVKNHIPYDVKALTRFVDKYEERINLVALSQFTVKISLKKFMSDRIKYGQKNFLDFVGTKTINTKAFNTIQSIKNQKVAFFTSSLDEVAILDKTFTYQNQLKQIVLAAKECQQYNWKLIVRHHPNLGTIGSPTEANIFIDAVNEQAEIYGFDVISPAEECAWSFLAARVNLNIVPYSSMLLDMMYFGFPCSTIGIVQWYGSIILDKKQVWIPQAKNLREASKAAQYRLFSKTQWRRTLFYAYIYYLGCCLSIPYANIKDTYFIDPNYNTPNRHDNVRLEKLLLFIKNIDGFPLPLASQQKQAN